MVFLITKIKLNPFWTLILCDIENGISGRALDLFLDIYALKIGFGGGLMPKCPINVSKP